MKNLVSADWLAENLSNPNLVILDCTNGAEQRKSDGHYVTTSGRDTWLEEHIPNSGHADFTDGLSSDDKRYRNMLPTSEQFATAMGKLGVGDESQVILYDTGGSSWASRVWWMLRWIGFDNAAVLDGGLQNWKLQGHPLSTAMPSCDSRILTPRLQQDIFIGKDTVENSLQDDSICLIDALTEEMFNGESAGYGLSGHIPGAINIPAGDIVDADSGVFHSDKQLEQRFPDDRSTKVIVYCGSGIAASAVAFVMHHQGYNDVKIYVPSLQEWLQDKDAPVVNDPRTLSGNR